MSLVLHVLRGSLAEGLENSKSDIDDAMIFSTGTLLSAAYPCKNLVRWTYSLYRFRNDCAAGDINLVSWLYSPVIYASQVGKKLIEERDQYITNNLYTETLHRCAITEARVYDDSPKVYPKGKELALVLKMLWWLYTAKTEQGLQVRPNEKLAKELKELRAGKCDNYQTLLNDLMKKVNKVWNK